MKTPHARPDYPRDPRTTAAPLPSGAAVGSEPSLAELGMRFWEDLLLRTRAT